MATSIKSSSADLHRRWSGINHAELRRALDFLEVRNEVGLRRVSARYHRGRHRGFADGTHSITVETYATVEQANRTILHELAHAAQMERFPTPEAWRRAYDLETVRNGYRDNAYEVEARAASEFSADFRIAR